MNIWNHITVKKSCDFYTLLECWHCYQCQFSVGLLTLLMSSSPSPHCLSLSHVLPLFSSQQSDCCSQLHSFFVLIVTRWYIIRLPSFLSTSFWNLQCFGNFCMSLPLQGMLCPHGNSCILHILFYLMLLFLLVILIEILFLQVFSLRCYIMYN